MRVLGVSIGKKIWVQYTDGINEKVLRSEERPRPELEEAFQALSLLWQESIIRFFTGLSMEEYRKSGMMTWGDPGEKRQLLRTEAVKVLMKYSGDRIAAVKAAGVMDFPCDCLKTDVSLWIEIRTKEWAEAAEKIADEGRRYAEGERAQMVLMEEQHGQE